MPTLRVALGARSYPIHIGAGLLAEPSSWEQALPRTRTSAVIVSNSTVAPLYATRLGQAIAPLFRTGVTHVTLPDGEAFKDWEHLQRIFDAMLAQRCDRKSVVFALGGGVVGDMAGFAAACFMRGVAFVQVPTTLLAQVDSSVGGKTAINHPLGKNMIGAFHQPCLVVIDTNTLATLPQTERIAGLAEVIKYGPIADATFFDWCEANIAALLAGDAAATAYAIERSCAIKADVVGQDETESGLRAMLNFGHTLGHAIESGLGYGTWLHGQAVGAGMVAAARLSQRLVGLSPTAVTRIQALVRRAGLPVELPREISAKQYLSLMQGDKKSEGGALRFVLVPAIGRAELREVSQAELLAFLHEVLA